MIVRVFVFLFHPLPVLRAVKWAHVAAHDQAVCIAGLEPVFEFIPFAFSGKQHAATLPMPVSQRHVFNNNHVQDRLVFALAIAFIAQMVEVFPHELDDLSILLPILFKNLDMAFDFAGFVVGSAPNADR